MVVNAKTHGIWNIHFIEQIIGVVETLLITSQVPITC
jgi:hypothetical protein